jgi:hypothetical protein
VAVLSNPQLEDFEELESNSDRDLGIEEVDSELRTN